MNEESISVCYRISDAGLYWKVETSSGKLSVCYKLPKAKYKDFEAVKDFIANELKGEVK